jgi:sialate O-acetylesterase
MMRELQQKSAELPNSGMVVTYDLGLVKNRYENNRQDIGKRLAKWALAKDYGKDEAFSGPLYQKIEVESDRLIVHFEHVDKGLMVGEKKEIDDVTPSQKELKGFAIAGQDEVWHRAKAIIDPEHHTVTLTSDQVKQPVSARYAYRSNPSESNLYNAAGLPAAPFRTDNWSLNK